MCADGGKTDKKSKRSRETKGSPKSIRRSGTTKCGCLANVKSARVLPRYVFVFQGLGSRSFRRQINLLDPSFDARARCMEHCPMTFSADEDFAKQLDGEDPLRGFREKFHLPLG